MTPYYSDDHVTIYHGDCLDLLDSIEAGVLVTDPPYGISWRKGENRAAGSGRHGGIANDSDTAIRDAVLAWWSGPAVVFGSLYAAYPAGLKQILIWEKPPDAGVIGSVTGWRRDIEAVFLVGPWPTVTCRSGSVLRSVIPNIGTSNSPAGQTGHPHAKPVDLMRALITAAPSGLVLDPFMGSGSTLQAAKELGRRAIGIELDERYCEIAARRCAQEQLDLLGSA